MSDSNSSNQEIIRTEENGVEYFTVVATGESAMSQRGLALMCGVKLNAIQYLLKVLDQQKPPQTFEDLVGQDLYLTNEIVKNGKDMATHVIKLSLITSNCFLILDYKKNHH